MTQAVAPSYTDVLEASTVYELDVSGLGAIQILNVDGVDAIAYTLDGNDPVPAGTGGEGFVLPAAIASATELVPTQNVQGADTGTTILKLISAGTPKFAVRATQIPTFWQAD